jgi:hypothetical protein
VTSERFFGPAAKINITVLGRLLKQIDEHARAHGETRGGFLTTAALEAMRRTSAHPRSKTAPLGPFAPNALVAGDGFNNIQSRIEIGLMRSPRPAKAPVL